MRRVGGERAGGGRGVEWYVPFSDLSDGIKLSALAWSSSSIWDLLTSKYTFSWPLLPCLKGSFQFPIFFPAVSGCSVACEVHKKAAGFSGTLCTAVLYFFFFFVKAVLDLHKKPILFLPFPNTCPSQKKKKACGWEGCWLASNSRQSEHHSGSV